MAVLNSTILQRARLQGSNDFAQRVPDPDIAGYAQSVAEVFNPYNGDLYTQFMGMLKGIMGTYVEGKRFDNPLAVLKKPYAGDFGAVERHMAVHYMQAHSYRADSETYLKFEPAKYEEWYYSLNQQRRYEFSFPYDEVQLAFSADGYGFNQLLAETLDQQISSDNYEEMNVMLETFAEADNKWGGLYRHTLSAAPTDQATARELLVALRAMVGRLQFPSRYYNHIPIPVHESPETLVLFVTPETKAVIDVLALAELFNAAEYASIRQRIITVPEFPIPDVYAALASEDFIYCRDKLYTVQPAFYNGETLTGKFWLHHWQIVGANPAANCILFTTQPNTAVIPTVTMEVTGAAFSPNAVNVEIGGKVQLNFALQGTVEGGNGKIAVEPDAATYQVSAIRAGEEEDVSISLNTRTYVSRDGILHVQKTGLQAGDIITVEATAAYVNPSGTTTLHTATATATVTNATVDGAKECPVEQEPYIEYTDDPDSTTASD